MAAFWGLHVHRGENGHCNVEDPYVVHLYFIFNHGFAADHLYDPRFLVEYETLYPFCQT
jgi:hypothetical protein